MTLETARTNYKTACAALDVFIALCWTPSEQHNSEDLAALDAAKRVAYNDLVAALQTTVKAYRATMATAHYASLHTWPLSDSQDKQTLINLEFELSRLTAQ